jgi:alkaline phosphatase
MKLLTLLLFVLTTTSVTAQSAPKNIIMVVGDGMGPEYVTAYRMYKDDPTTPQVEPTVFDSILVGMASTTPVMSEGYVTDSAAGATALATGVKTYNGAIAVDVNKQPLLTVLEYAKQQGRKTGIAVTSQINHATPAGFSTHNESRQNYNAIADSYFDAKINGQFRLYVMLGGGWKYFKRPDRDLISQFQQAGYQYIDDMAQLSSVIAQQPLLGLFADAGLPWALDMPGHTRLAPLVETAVNQLENDQGFFLLVEASQIDWGGHSNDVAASMGEMHDLALTLEWLKQYVSEHPDTLVVVTADHSTGGFTIGAREQYQWAPQWLQNLSASPETLAKRLLGSSDKVTLAESVLGFSLNPQEKAQLLEISEQTQKAYYKVVTAILDERSISGWTTHGHTGVDVPVFAFGHSSENFRGHLDNTDIAKNIFKLMGKMD